MRRNKRKARKRAGRYFAVPLACALVILCAYIATDRLVDAARRRLTGVDVVLQEATAAPTEQMPSVPFVPIADELGEVMAEEKLVVVQADPMSVPTETRESASPTALPIPQAIAQSEETLRLTGGERVHLAFTGLCIGIDPGHQEHGNSDQEPVAPGSKETKAKVSTGTSGAATGTPEYAVNLDIALKLRDRLEGLGAEVIMTRTTNDVDISNIERAQMCNEAGADIVLRLHCNGATNEQANGIGLYVTETGSIAQASYSAAELLLPAMARATGARPAGIFRRDTYSGLNWSTVPSILVEMGYMSNYEEDLKLESPEYQELLVDGMTRGLAQIFGRSLDEEGN